MGPKRVCPLTPEQLRAYSQDHLWYEVSMFYQTGIVLPGGVTSPRVEFIDNSILESFVIHLRNLLDFFYPGQSVKADDVIAADYFEPGELPPAFSPISQILQDSEIRAHKQVSHLTTKRVAGNHPDKYWYPSPIMTETTKVISLFVDLASPHRLASEFSTRFRELLSQVKR